MPGSRNGLRIFKVEQSEGHNFRTYCISSEKYKISVANQYVKASDGDWLYSFTTVAMPASVSREAVVWLIEALQKALADT